MTVPLFGQGSAVPVQVLIGRGRPSLNISTYVDLDGGGLKIEDTGNQADDGATVELIDVDRIIDDIGPEARILIKTGQEERFRGFVRQFTPKPFTKSNRIILSCVGVSSLLDTCIIPPGSAYTRSHRESDRARLLWLLKTFGQPFLSHASNDFRFIQVLERGMDRQKFGSLTLRQAIEQVLAASSESANYWVDQQGRIHTWDKEHEEVVDAPYEVNTAISPAANEVAPQNLEITWDTSELINYYIVRGANRAGSGEFSDEESIELYGRRQGFVDGPNSDTAKKARRLGRAALNDTKNPTKRVSFTVDDDQISRNGVVWAPGQRLYVTAPGFGWLRHKLRIVRVTSRYLDSTGRRAMDIEAGAFRRSFLNIYMPGPGGGGFPPGYTPGGPNIFPVPPWSTDSDDRDPTFPPPTGSAGNPSRIGVTSGRESTTTRPITITVPDGSDIADRTLILFASWDHGAGSDNPAVVAAFEDSIGLTHVPEAGGLSVDFVHAAFYRTLTGGEEFGPTGATFDVTLPASVPNGLYVRWVAVLYAGTGVVQGNAALRYATADINPPGFTPSGAPGSSAIWLAHASSSDGIKSPRAPSGYTNLAYVGPESGVDSSEPQELARQTTVSVGTSHTIVLPTGVHLPDRQLLLAYTTTDADASAVLRDQFTALGFSLLEDYQNYNSMSGGLFNRALTGAQGYGTGINTVVVTTPATETIIAFAALIEGASAWSTAEATNLDNPSASGWVGETEICYIFGYDNAAISGGPAEFTVLDTQTSGGAAFRVGRAIKVGATNPGVWTGSGTAPFSITALGRYQDLSDVASLAVAQRDGANTAAAHDPSGMVSSDTVANHIAGCLVLGGSVPREGELLTDTFTGDGATTTFSLTATILALSSAQVDGIAILNATISTTAHTITFDAAPATGAVVKVVYHAGQAPEGAWELVS